MTDEPRQSTLRDYLVVLRRRRLMVVAITLIAALAALLLSFTQTKTYVGIASLRVHDPTQDFPVAGLPQATSNQLPAQIAAQAAQTADRTSVLRRVKSRLRLQTPISELRSKVSTMTDPTSNLVQLQGSADTAQGAANLANAAAGAVVAASNQATQRHYSAIAKKLQEQVDRLNAKLPDNFSSLSPSAQGSFQNIVRQQQVLGAQSARLLALSAVSDPVQISERASPPAPPRAPKPIRNAILGAFVGLFVGLISAWLAESLDRRLRTAAEATALLDFPLVGAVEKGTLGTVPVGEGADREQLAHLDAFRMLRNNIRFLGGEHPPKSILVTSPLPEEGKTTVATGIAIAAAASGLLTLLVEADLRQPVHAERLGLQEKPGLADFLRDGLSPSDVVQVHHFVDPAALPNGDDAGSPQSNLVCITAGSMGPISGEILGSPQFATFLGQVQTAYDLVVIDSAPLLAVAETMQIVRLVDSVIYCVRLGQTTVDQAVAGQETLDRLGDRLKGLVVTDLKTKDADYGSYTYTYHYKHKSTPAEHV